MKQNDRQVREAIDVADVILFTLLTIEKGERISFSFFRRKEEREREKNIRIVLDRIAFRPFDEQNIFSKQLRNERNFFRTMTTTAATSLLDSFGGIGGVIGLGVSVLLVLVMVIGLVITCCCKKGGSGSVQPMQSSSQQQYSSPPYGYPPPGAYPPQSGYPPPGAYPPQSGYPPQPGYGNQSAYPPSYGQPQRQARQQRSGEM